MSNATTAHITIGTMNGDLELDVAVGTVLLVGDGRTNVVKAATITKITATRITVKNGDSYVIKTGKRVGDTGSFFPMKIMGVR